MAAQSRSSSYHATASDRDFDRISDIGRELEMKEIQAEREEVVQLSDTIFQLEPPGVVAAANVTSNQQQPSHFQEIRSHISTFVIFFGGVLFMVIVIPCSFVDVVNQFEVAEHRQQALDNKTSSGYVLIDPKKKFCSPIDFIQAALAGANLSGKVDILSVQRQRGQHQVNWKMDQALAKNIQQHQNK